MPAPTIMNSSWMTDIGRRPDLEALDVNPPIGYIGDRLYPRTKARFAAGSISGMTLPTYAAAQTSRVDGAAPSITLITNNAVSYSCTEIISRYGKTASQVMDTMDLYACDQQGATGAIRSMMYKLEQARLLKAVTPVDGDYNLITMSAADNILDTITSALEAIRLYQGRRVLVMGATTLQKFGRAAALTDFYAGAPLIRRESFQDLRERIVTAIQSVFLLDEVLIADESILNAAGNASAIGNYIVAAVIPHENEVNEFSYTLNPELGRTVVYQPYEGLKPYMVESWPNGNTLTNEYTASTRAAVVEINAMAKRIIDTSSANWAGGLSVDVTGGTIVTIDGGTVSA